MSTRSSQRKTSLQVEGRPIDDKKNAESRIERSCTDNASSTSTLVEERDTQDSLPNGGLVAWLQVAGSWFLYLNTLGISVAFGAFQAYYEDNPYWKRSSSDISWIGSLQTSIFLTVGVVTGVLYDMGYLQYMLWTGAFTVPLGYMLTSLCKTYWQTLLAQGVFTGFACGILFVPSLAIVPHYFSTRKSLATAIVTTGGSVGGIIYPIIFRALEQRLGFGWAVRGIGFIIFGGVLFSACVMKPRSKPQEQRKLVDLSAFQERPYVLYIGAYFFAAIGYWVPIFYIQTYALSTNIASLTFSTYLIAILNAASIPGRVIAGALTNHVGVYNVFITSTAISGILVLAWMAIHNLDGTIAFCILYGFFSGTIASLFSMCGIVLTKDLHSVGTRLGQAFFIFAIGCLTGPPIAGAIFSGTDSFIGLQLFSGVCLFVTVGFAVAVRVSLVGWGFTKKG